MQISNLHGFGGVASTYASQTGSNNSLGGALAGLINAINAGDHQLAQGHLGAVQTIAAGLSGNSALGQFVEDAGTALSTGDISAARQAVFTLQTRMATVSPAADVPQPAESDAERSARGAVGGQVMDLFEAMSKGDLAAAQSAYNTLKAVVAKATGSHDALSSRVSASLEEVGQSLTSGDMRSARWSLAGALKGLSSGSILDTTA